MKSEVLLPTCLESGHQWNGHRTARGPGAQRTLTFPDPPAHWFSGARKCEPALLASLLACCSTNPQHPYFCTPRAPRSPTSALSDSRREGAVGAQGVSASQTSVTAAACPHSGRAGRTATGDSPSPECGARAGDLETPSRAAAPDGLKLTGGHRGAGQAGVAGRCHLRAPARRFSLSPGADAAAAALARPLAASAAPAHGKVQGTRRKHQPRTLPALPAPPDDALLPPLFVVVSVPLGAFARCSPGCPGGRWEPREAEGRPERTNRASAQPQLRAALPGARLEPGLQAAHNRSTSSPHPPRGLLLPGRASQAARARQQRRQTDRATSPSPSAPTPRAHKEGEETQELRGTAQRLRA